jgi:hypothetical protein
MLQFASYSSKTRFTRLSAISNSINSKATNVTIANLTQDDYPVRYICSECTNSPVQRHPSVFKSHRDMCISLFKEARVILISDDLRLWKNANSIRGMIVLKVPK